MEGDYLPLTFLLQLLLLILQQTNASPVREALPFILQMEALNQAAHGLGMLIMTEPQIILHKIHLTHIQSPGLYSVKLTINNGSHSITKENHILVMNAEPTINTGCSLSSNSNGGNGYGIGIYRFAINSIDFSTPYNDGYYHNYTCQNWTKLELNQTYNITIQTGTANNEGAKVYIDYNDNGTFETGEAIVSFPANKVGTRTLSFTTPSSGVVLDKGIRLRVLSKFGSIPSTACDISTYGQAEDYTAYFTGDATWTGTASTDWATSGNWNISSVPVTGAKIIIPSGAPNYPLLTSDVTCKDLTIMSGASLTINPGKALTVSGTANQQCRKCRSCN